MLATEELFRSDTTGSADPAPATAALSSSTTDEVYSPSSQSGTVEEDPVSVGSDSVTGNVSPNNSRHGFYDVYFSTMETIKVFVGLSHVGLRALKTRARRLKLVVTLTGRTRNRLDRIGFGLSSKVTNRVGFAVKKTLFRWGLRAGGFYFPGVDNRVNVEMYKR